MTLVTQQWKPSNAADADFRLFVTNFRAGFTSLGWTRSADTGQIDPTTVVKPAAINTAQGYDIFIMGDALQASAPCFVKVEYGSGSVASNHGIWITVGTGSNGSGTLTGQLSSRFQMTSNTDTNLRNHTFAGGSNRIAVFSNELVSNGVYFFCIERSHADDGSDTNERIDVLTGAALLSALNFMQIPFTGPVPVNQTSLPVLMPPSGNGQKGTDVGVYAVFPNMAGPLRNPLVGVMIYISTDLTNMTDYAIPLYGVSRTYRAHATDFSNVSMSRCANSQAGPLMLVS